METSFNLFSSGRVFRHFVAHNYSEDYAFQSLWSRAGSFDTMTWIERQAQSLSFNPFGAGQGLSTLNRLIDK